jgi:dihydroorotate dehydrogenase electron transfer subunit
MRILRQRADVAEPANGASGPPEGEGPEQTAASAKEHTSAAAAPKRPAGPKPVQLREAQVLRVVRDGSYTRLAVHAPAIAEIARPGQFVAFAVGGPTSGLMLRRSFSIARVGPAGTIEVVVAPVGPGTRWLTARVAGDRVDITGPLGRPFPLPVAAAPGHGPRALLVGGGYGSAPLFALAAALRQRGCHITMALGAATEDKLYGVPEARRVSDECSIATDDGSAGVTGRVTSAFDPTLAKIDVVYACGPMAMLGAVSRLAKSAGIPSYIAVEEAMACGIGVCMTCVLPIKPKGAPLSDVRMIRACTDGPVFPGEVVQFDLIGQVLPVATSPAAQPTNATHVPPTPTSVEAPI